MIRFLLTFRIIFSPFLTSNDWHMSVSVTNLWGDWQSIRNFSKSLLLLLVWPWHSFNELLWQKYKNIVEIHKYAKRKYLSSLAIPSMYCLWQYCLSSDTVTSAKCHYFACFTLCKQAFLAHNSLVDICNDCLDTLKCILTWVLANLAIEINWYWHLNWPFQIRLIFFCKV